MPIMWKRFAAELKRRRGKLGMTQDVLAAKIGVRWNTIARLEIGQRRPSLDILEKLAVTLRCRVRDLLPEKEKKMTTQTAREPSMTGAPTYFRVGVSEAKHRKVIGHSADTGKPIRADYSYPGWHFAIHVEEYLDDEALEELEQLADSVDRFGGEEFERKIEAFLKREFPGCMALVPNARRTKFMEGVLKAIEDGRFRIG